MRILALIGAFILFILARFVAFLIRQKREMKRVGGVEKRYSEILHWIEQEYPGAKIYDNKPTSVLIGLQRNASSVSFNLLKTYESLTVRYRESGTLIGTKEKVWQFPENMPQQNMIDQINADIVELSCGRG